MNILCQIDSWNRLLKNTKFILFFWFQKDWVAEGKRNCGSCFFNTNRVSSIKSKTFLNLVFSIWLLLEKNSYEGVWDELTQTVVFSHFCKVSFLKMLQICFHKKFPVNVQLKVNWRCYSPISGKCSQFRTP